MRDDDRARLNDTEHTVTRPVGERGPVGQGTGELLPLLVDGEGSDFSVIWLYARRSEMTRGTTFSARGRRWVITGPSPSGVTFTCRELRDGEGG